MPSFKHTSIDFLVINPTLTGRAEKAITNSQFLTSVQKATYDTSFSLPSFIYFHRRLMIYKSFVYR